MQRFYGVEVEDGAPGAWALAPGGVAAGMRQRLVLPPRRAWRSSAPAAFVRRGPGCCAAARALRTVLSLRCRVLPRLPNRPCSYPRATFSRLPPPARAATLGAAGARCLRRSLSLSSRCGLRSGRSCFVVPGAAVLLCCCGQGQSRSAGSERQRRRQALGGGQICRLRHCTAFRCPALPYHAPRTLVTDERVGWGVSARCRLSRTVLLRTGE